MLLLLLGLDPTCIDFNYAHKVEILQSCTKLRSFTTVKLIIASFNSCPYNNYKLLLTCSWSCSVALMYGKMVSKSRASSSLSWLVPFLRSAGICWSRAKCLWILQLSCRCVSCVPLTWSVQLAGMYSRDLTRPPTSRICPCPSKFSVHCRCSSDTSSCGLWGRVSKMFPSILWMVLTMQYSLSSSCPRRVENTALASCFDPQLEQLHKLSSYK